MPSVYHSRFNRVVAIVVWALEVFLLVSGVIGGVLQRHPGFVVPAAFAALAVFALLWHPKVVVDDAGTTLVNVLVTVVVPWAALIDVDTKYSLSLRTPGRAYAAWAAPAPGRTGIAMARRTERRHGDRETTPTLAGRARPGDLVATESGAAAYLVRSRWQELVEAGRVEAGVAESTPVTTRVHWTQSGALLVLAAGSVYVLGWL